MATDSGMLQLYRLHPETDCQVIGLLNKRYDLETRNYFPLKELEIQHQW
jgi:hypothetical protein